jgi:hypothetical protein
MNRVLPAIATLALSLAVLAGCGKKEADSSMMSSGTPSAGAASAVTPPPSGDAMPSATGTGPAGGSTAIGAHNTDPGAPGGGTGGRPAPTAGDGASAAR